MKLKTKEQHNAEKKKIMDKIKKRINRTGVACPKCGREMIKADNQILLSSPPKRNVICEKCGHKDVILA